MFACALYPRNSAFLRNVEAEVKEQILRLRHHPSVLCWAGNNENELAIRSVNNCQFYEGYFIQYFVFLNQFYTYLSAQWYAEWNYEEEAQVNDYLALYKATIQPVANSLDPSRPFLLSSPSNGMETER
jgi:beta-mannosidase